MRRLFRCRLEAFHRDPHHQRVAKNPARTWTLCPTVLMDVGTYEDHRDARKYTVTPEALIFGRRRCARCHGRLITASHHPIDTVAGGGRKQPTAEIYRWHRTDC